MRAAPAHRWRERLAAVLAWLGGRLAGPPCPASCGYYARGHRTLLEHLEANEACMAIAQEIWRARHYRPAGEHIVICPRQGGKS